MPGKRMTLIVCALVVMASVSGCYYTQAMRGQFELMRKREPIADVINDPATPEELARRLRLVLDAREFSIRELGLPDNDSYRSYADLERDYVVWNVFAAPEFSVTPKTWCYPVVGCVSYRGYFDREKAERLAERLREDGYDVFTGGVAAYSTLGRFSDPVLNTMMRWDDVQLVSVLFHELAHQVLYIKDDTGFNESFATAVEEFGIERFLESRGAGENFESYREREKMSRDLVNAVTSARADLETLYASDVREDDMRSLKAERIERLTIEIGDILSAAGRDPESWLSRPFNNARIASMALYEGLLPAFREVFADCEEQIECFYAEARRISELEPDAREAHLSSLTK